MDAAQGKDLVCKRLFRHRGLVRDLLRGYVPGRWVRQVDYGTLRLLPTEFVGRTGHRRFGDVLWVASLRDGRQVMPMIEVQSAPDAKMAARMTGYLGMAYESLTPTARGPDGRYPAVLPLVVYTGGERWGATTSLSELVDPVAGLAGYAAGRRYARLDLCSLARDDPRQTNRLGVLARLTAAPLAGTVAPLAETVAVLRSAAVWLRRPERGADAADAAEDRSLFAAYVDWVKVLLPQLGPVADPDPAVVMEWRELMEGLTGLEMRAREWEREWLRQGREEGREEGLERGQRALLGRQASRRFGAAAANRLAAALADIRDPARLEAVADLILDCDNGAELLDRVGRIRDGRGDGEV